MCMHVQGLWMIKYNGSVKGSVTGLRMSLTIQILPVVKGEESIALCSPGQY